MTYYRSLSRTKTSRGTGMESARVYSCEYRASNMWIRANPYITHYFSYGIRTWFFTGLWTPSQLPIHLGNCECQFVNEVKYLGVMIHSSMKTTIDVTRQTKKFYMQANLLLRNFRHCSDDVKCSLLQTYCTNMYCCQLWFNSTKRSINKLFTIYNSVLRRLLCISKPYSASNMFVSRGIPSFAELLRKSIYRFTKPIEVSSNSIIASCLSPLLYISSPVRKWWSSVLYVN